MGSGGAEEVSSPQEPHLPVLKGSPHCFVFLLITKAVCNNDHQWHASSGKDAHTLTQTHTLSPTHPAKLKMLYPTKGINQMATIEWGVTYTAEFNTFVSLRMCVCECLCIWLSVSICLSGAARRLSSVKPWVAGHSQIPAIFLDGHWTNRGEPDPCCHTRARGRVSPELSLSLCLSLHWAPIHTPTHNFLPDIPNKDIQKRRSVIWCSMIVHMCMGACAFLTIYVLHANPFLYLI